MREIKAETEQQTALRNFLFVFAKSIGIIWLVSKLPFLKLKPEYQLREDNPDLLR